MRNAAACALLACGLLAVGTGFDLDPFDSAEFALVAVTRGLAHPPGHPLHTLLGWLLTRGPWPPLIVLALLSIVPAAVGIASRATEQTESLVAALGATAVVCALAPVRSVTTRIEVYALAAMCTVMALRSACERSHRADVLTGVWLGFATCTNPVLAAQGVGAIALIPLESPGRRVGALARLCAGGVLGLAPMLYVLAARARATETLVWAAPHGLGEWWAMLLARDFAGHLSLSAFAMARHAVHLVGDLARSGALLILLVALWVGHKRDRWVIGSSMLIGATMISVNDPYQARNPDYGGYLLVPLMLSAGPLGALLRRFAVRWRAATLGGAVVAALVGLVRDRPSHVTRQLAANILTSAPPGAIALVSADHLLFPVLYLQGVEHLRTDVTVLNPGWASSRWAWAWAMRRDPSLRVDLTPGRGRIPRLAGVLTARSPGRAVLSDQLDLLRRVAPGPVCARGLAWATSEACDRPRASMLDGMSALRTIAHGAHGAWDRTLVAYTGVSMGDAAWTLGCPGIAQGYYAAARGLVPPTSLGACGAPRPPPPPVGLLDVRSEDLDVRLGLARGSAEP